MLTFASSVRMGVYVGMSTMSEPSLMSCAARVLSRMQLPQNIPAPPAVMNAIFGIVRVLYGRRERVADWPTFWSPLPTTGHEALATPVIHQLPSGSLCPERHS